MKTYISAAAAALLLASPTLVYCCDTVSTINRIELRFFPESDEPSKQPTVPYLMVTYGSHTIAAIFDTATGIWYTTGPSLPVKGKAITLETPQYSFSFLNAPIFECDREYGKLYCELLFRKKTGPYSHAFSSAYKW